MRLLRAAAILPLSLAALNAHDVISTKITFAREISRVLYKRCTSCHREGGKAPMALLTYEDARPWAKAIKEEVLERRMPPWGAVKGFGAFQEDQSLTQEEIALIADWVEGGAPEGEPKYLPPAPAAPPGPTRPKGRLLTARNGLQLAAPATLLAIQPKARADVASVRVYADQPDGSSEPLVWLKGYRPRWPHTFTFRKPVKVAAGTRIRVEPEGQADFVLIQK